MNRSVTSRNFAGGFLGGALGILTSWYVAPQALPVGVLIGVLVGWWAEDIVQIFIHSFRVARRFWWPLVTHVALEMFLNVCATRISNGISRTLGYAAMSFRWIAMNARASARVPMRVAHWASHPSNTALLITISAIVVGVTINALAFSMFWNWPETKTIASGVVILVVFGMFGLLGVLLQNIEGDIEEISDARRKRYLQYSPVTYFARELFRFFKAEVMITSFYVLTLAYWATLGGALIVLVMIPVATFVTFMVGLYKIAQRSAHLWCLAVTMVVTCASALIFYSSFNNETILWAIALCTGFVSGATTEGLLRLGTWWGDTTMGRHYLGIWHDEKKILLLSIAIPAWRALTQAFANVSHRVLPLAI